MSVECGIEICRCEKVRLGEKTIFLEIRIGKEEWTGIEIKIRDMCLIEAVLITLCKGDTCSILWYKGKVLMNLRLK